MSQLRVLVVGASIAGPTTAYWFAKAGAKVTVIERFPHLRTNGQNIDIRTVGVNVMRKIQGMEQAVLAKVLPMEGISFVDAKGHSYGTIKPTGNPDQQSLVSEYEIFRGDLAKILFDLTKDNKNINYVFGEQVASIRQHEKGDGPVAVEFMNGHPTSEYDLVVACDGATSRTRAIGLGGGVRDHIKPINAWAAFFTIKEDLLKGDKIGRGYSAPGGRFMGIGPYPLGGNQVTLMNFYPRTGGDVTQPFREAMKQGDDALKKFVANHFKDAGWVCEEAMQGMMEARDFYASETVQVKPPSLYNGRFVMVGDAGYAPGPTGGGTSLALAGAYLLAGEVCKNKDDLQAGLEGYAKQMRPIIADLQTIPPIIPTAVAPQTSWGIWIRNNIFAFICWTRIIEFTQKFFAGSFASSDKHKLPDYDWVE